MRYRNSRGDHNSACANTRFRIETNRDESVVDVLCGLCGAGIVIAFIDPIDGSWSDDLVVSDNKWRPMIDAVLYHYYCS